MDDIDIFRSPTFSLMAGFEKLPFLIWEFFFLFFIFNMPLTERLRCNCASGGSSTPEDIGPHQVNWDSKHKMAAIEVILFLFIERCDLIDFGNFLKFPLIGEYNSTASTISWKLFTRQQVKSLSPTFVFSFPLLKGSLMESATFCST